MDSTCEVCLESYNVGAPKRVPKILQCGHTFCSACLERLIVRQSIICPRCRRKTPGIKTVADVPKNFSLIETLSKAHSKCKQHDENLKLFCNVDQVPICHLCSIAGSHVGHDVALLTDASKKSKASLKKHILSLESRVSELTKFNTCVTQRTDAVNRDCDNAKVEIEDKFDELIQALHRREDFLFEQVEDHREAEANYFGDLKSKIEHSISEFTARRKKADAVLGENDDIVVVNEFLRIEPSIDDDSSRRKWESSRRNQVPGRNKKPPGKRRAKKKWACPACTYDNPAGMAMCNGCGTRMRVQPGPPESAYPAPLQPYFPEAKHPYSEHSAASGDNSELEIDFDNLRRRLIDADEGVSVEVQFDDTTNDVLFYGAVITRNSRNEGGHRLAIRKGVQQMAPRRYGDSIPPRGHMHPPKPSKDAPIQNIREFFMFVRERGLPGAHCNTYQDGLLQNLGITEDDNIDLLARLDDIHLNDYFDVAGIVDADHKRLLAECLQKIREK